LTGAGTPVVLRAMYTIIGGDGKEYGPVSAEQVRAWVAGGRANLKTKIKAPGGDEWKSVADFPELTGEAPQGAFPGATPAPAYPDPAADLDILSCYERSWALLKANFWPLVGVNLVIMVLFALIGYTQFIGVFFVSPLFGGLIAGGLYYYVLLKARGLPTTFGDAFAGFTKAPLALLVAGILIFLFTSLGLICLVIPGIYLIVAYVFTYVLAVDKGLGFWEAMEMSRKVATRQWWRVLGLLLLGIPFILLGVAALVIGVFVTIPLITGAFVYAYEDLFNPKR
jgi:hypothetical protein